MLDNTTPKTVSLGLYRDDGDFAVLATLNNNDAHFDAVTFAQIVDILRLTLSVQLGEGVAVLERQDTPDYVSLD